MSQTSKDKKNITGLVLVIVFVIAGILFILAALLIYEYGSKTTANGDTVIPWYFWLLIAFGFLCFLICIIIYIYVPSGLKSDKSVETKKEGEEMMIAPGVPIVPTGYIISTPSKHKLVVMEPSMSNLETLAR